MAVWAMIFHCEADSGHPGDQRADERKRELSISGIVRRNPAVFQKPKGLGIRVQWSVAYGPQAWRSASGYLPERSSASPCARDRARL